MPAGHHHHEDEVGTLWDDPPTPQGPPYFANDDHALYAGMLIGKLMQAGVKAYPSVDEHGDYMNEIVIELDPGVESMKVKISVLPPL